MIILNLFKTISNQEKNNFITEYENHSTDTDVRIICKVTDEFIFDYEHPNGSTAPDADGITFIEKQFKLTTNKSLMNFVFIIVIIKSKVQGCI